MVARVFWILDGVIFLVTLYYARQVVRSRRGRGRALRASQHARAAGHLKTRPPIEQLIAAWEAVLERPPVSRKWPEVERLVARLCEADQGRVQELRHVALSFVNIDNDLAGRIDDRLLRASDFVRRNPELHQELLKELALLEPFIWFESLMTGRGRWGYGPLHLRTVLRQLRPLSPDPLVRGRLNIELLGRQYEVEDGLSALRGALGYLRSRLRPPRISVRTKLRQNRRAVRCARRLRQAGYEPVNMYHHSVAW